MTHVDQLVERIRKQAGYINSSPEKLLLEEMQDQLRLYTEGLALLLREAKNVDRNSNRLSDGTGPAGGAPA